MRKIKLLAAVLAMTLMVAAPASAQTIEFVGQGVFVGTGGAGAFANPNIAGAAFTPGAISGASTQLGYFAAAGGGPCIDTTGFGIC